MKLAYPAIFLPWDDTPGYTVEVPDLPGCVSEGASLAEAFIMGTDAASGWVLTELEDGKPAPPASAMADIHPDEEGGFVSLLVLDMDAYAEKYGRKEARKSLRIPAWLNAYGESRHVDFSRMLQESLMSLYQRETAAA